MMIVLVVILESNLIIMMVNPNNDIYNNYSS